MATFLSEVKKIVCIRLGIAFCIVFFSTLLASLNGKLLLNAGAGLWTAGFITLSNILSLISFTRTGYVSMVHQSLSFISTFTAVVINAFTLRNSLRKNNVSIEACIILLGVTIVLMCIEVFISIFVICSSVQKAKNNDTTLAANKNVEAHKGLLSETDEKVKET